LPKHNKPRAFAPAVFHEPRDAVAVRRGARHFAPCARRHLIPGLTGKTMLKKESRYVVAVVIAACAVGSHFWMQTPGRATRGEYNPVINSEDFVPRVDRYFTLKPGTKFTYEDRMGTLRIRVGFVTENRSSRRGPDTSDVWRGCPMLGLVG
jgi:hypothetical protein